MEQKIMYICDPAKNTKCGKHGCVHNPKSKHPICSTTRHVEFKKDGTEPMLYPPGGEQSVRHPYR